MPRRVSNPPNPWEATHPEWLGEPPDTIATSRAFWSAPIARAPGAPSCPVFRERMTEALPEKAKRVFGAITEVRGGKWNESEFGARMRGVGPRWEAIRGLFDAQCRRLGLNEGASPDRPSPFRRPSAQAELFG